MENNRPTLFHIYTILKQHSNPDKPLNATAIMNELARQWKLPKPPDRKTVYSHLEHLQELSDRGFLDGEVEAVEENGRKIGYYFRPALHKSEIKLLCDVIASSRFIAKQQSKDLIRKLGAPFGNEFVGKYNYVLELKDPREKSYNSGLFTSIGTLSEAIEGKKKVSFQYLQYDLNKNLVPKYTENNGYLTVSPYYLIWTLDHYYLYCHFDSTGEERFLRVDKICNADILEENIIPPKLQPSYDLRDYTRNQAFMFGGDMTRIKLRCQMRMLGQVIDFLGESAEIRPIDDGHFEVQFVTSIESIKYWVLQYITAIDEIHPARLRDIVMGYVEDALRRLK